MSTYEDATADYSEETVLPPRVVKLPLSAWCSTYAGKPECDVRIGIRLPGQEDAEIIEAEALKAMQEATRGGEAAAFRAYNEAKLLNLVALCICSPTDVSAPHELFETPNAILQIALTPQGIRRLFDEIERLQVETSPIFREASDIEVSELAESLVDGALSRCTDPTKASQIRRFLGFCIEILTDV
jgi:hypothetical protein